MTEYHQLDIYWVNLEPTVGRETQKKRPCVIIQSDIVNKKSQTLIFAPLLSDHKPWPFAVNIAPTQLNGLDKERHLNLKQLRVVDIMRTFGNSILSTLVPGRIVWGDSLSIRTKVREMPF